jgi:hypothetical protein
MKALFTFAVLGLLGAAIAGCEASAEIDPDDDTTVRTTRTDRDNDTSVRKTTTIEEDGDRTTRTEIRRD